MIITNYCKKNRDNILVGACFRTEGETSSRRSIFLTYTPDLNLWFQKTRFHKKKAFYFMEPSLFSEIYFLLNNYFPLKMMISKIRSLSDKIGWRLQTFKHYKPNSWLMWDSDRNLGQSRIGSHRLATPLWIFIFILKNKLWGIDPKICFTLLGNKQLSQLVMIIHVKCLNFCMNHVYVKLRVFGFAYVKFGPHTRTGTIIT